MSKRFKQLFRKPKKYESVESVKGLNPNALEDLGKQLLIALGPLLAMLVVLAVLPRFYYVDTESMQLVCGFGLVSWVCIVAGYYAYVKSDSASKKLHDREFGYDERHHPVNEVYVSPPDIREVWNPTKIIDKFGDFQQRLNMLNLTAETKTALEEQFKDNLPKMYMYYFRHADAFRGLDFQRNEIKYFNSHIVFTDEPYDKQFCFSEGQENWYKCMLFNHPNAERDAVKVLGWGLDPETKSPMPLCRLVHSSKAYRRINNDGDSSKTNNNDFKLMQALEMLAVYQHAVIDEQMRDIANLKADQDAKLHEVNKISEHAHKIAEADFKLEDDILEPPRKHLWQKTWFKVAITIATLAAIVLVVGQVLNWLDLSSLFGG